MTLTLRCLVASLLLMFAMSANATTGAQTVWRLLDYIAVDYAVAVQDGEVVSEGEYAEMVEFADSVNERMAALPATSETAELIDGAAALQAAIDAKADPSAVAGLARGLAGQLLQAYPMPVAPSSTPDLAAASGLYQQQCASCHGTTGAGDGPAGVALDPAPIAFTDRERARERSIFALYQVIEQGLEGTSMGSYAHLPVDDRWALSFHIGQYAYPEALVDEGRRLWEGDDSLRLLVPDLAALTQLTPAALAEEVGEDRAAALMAYLRRTPEAVEARPEGSLTLSRQRLAEGLAAYAAGDRGGARDLMLSAYLDGFEPVEPLLASRDPALMARIETAMGELRSRIASSADVEEVQAQVAVVNGLFDDAEATLSPDQATAVSSFIGAFTILLREGLEALLIVIAMIGFLRKAERPDQLRYVHLGWSGALVAGFLTWLAATSFITISGASRELTEGFGSVLAAAILLFVGVWMHGKAQAGAWQAYVRDRLDAALSKGSAWFLFFLAFLAVYREVFETIIFFAAMGSGGNAGALAAGVAVGVVLLALIAWAMLRLSARLPIARFFQYSAVLIAVLAVVLVGKGVAALQEAGMLGVNPLANWPRSPLLGIYPTVESMAAQGAMILLLAAGFLWTSRRRPAPV